MVESSPGLSPLSPLFSWLHCAAFQILVPYLGTKSGPSAVKAQSPNHGTTREFPQLSEGSHFFPVFSSVQFSSVAQLCPTLCDPMNRSTPGLPVHHQLPEFTQTHIHRVCDAIQPSHPLSSPTPPAPNLSQHQSLFQ